MQQGMRWPSPEVTPEMRVLAQHLKIDEQSRIADSLDGRRSNALGCMTPAGKLVAGLVWTG
jgi:hypothetical protein